MRWRGWLVFAAVVSLVLQGFVPAVAAGVVDEAFESALGLVPGLTARTLHGVTSIAKKLGLKVARYLQKLRLARVREGTHEAITAWDLGSAIGKALVSGDYMKELVF